MRNEGGGGGRKAGLHRHAGPGLPGAARRPAGVLPPHSPPGSCSSSPWGTTGGSFGAGHTGCWVLPCTWEGLIPCLERGLRTGGPVPLRAGWGGWQWGGAPLGLGVRLSGAWQGL